MALRTVTVKSSGGDYSSLNAAFVGESANLVSLDRQLEIVCYNVVDTTTVATGAGFTTDATHTVMVRAADNHNGIYGGSDGVSTYRLEASTATRKLLNVQDETLYVTFRGLSLAIEGTVVEDATYLGAKTTVDRCILKSQPGIWAFVSDGARIMSSIAQRLGAGSSGFVTISGTAHIDNCTAIGTTGSAIGFACSAPGIAVVRNCLSSGCGTAWSGTFDTASTNCASDTAAVPEGTNHRASQTFTFVDAANGDYHLSTIDKGGLGCGADLSTDATYPVTLDIDSESIAAPWNIGADQRIRQTNLVLYPVAGSDTTLVLRDPTSRSTTYTYTPDGGLTSAGAAAVAARAAIAPAGGLTASGTGTIRARAAIVPSGGLTSGGSATSSLRRRFAPSGGLVAAGAAVIIASAHLVASGGLASSGAATIATRATVVASGGLTSGGAATTATTHRYTYAPDGGLSSSGAATIAARAVPAPSGGLTASGVATVATRARIVASGGLASGGTATIAVRAVVTPSGGLTSSGVATVDRRYRFTPSGGLDSGGEAGVIFAPASGGTTFSYSASGGLTSGGTATNALGHAVVAVGGLDSGGSATTRQRRAFAASGGLTASGSAAIVRTAVVHGAGGLTASGTASIVAARSFIATGGLTSSGTGTSRYRHAFTPSGGLSSGGTATVAFSRHFAFVAMGGITAGGAATIVRGAVIVPSGGLVSGGAAKTQFFREDKFLVAIPRSRVYIAALAESRVTVEFAPVLTAESHSRPLIEAVASSQAVQRFDETIVSAVPRSHPLIAATALSRVLTFILT